MGNGYALRKLVNVIMLEIVYLFFFIFFLSEKMYPYSHNIGLLQHSTVRKIHLINLKQKYILSAYILGKTFLP